jgi:hypothetical protein
VKELFFSVINVLNVSDVRQIEIHTPGSLVPSPSYLEVEIGNAKLKKYNLQVVFKFWQS